MAHARVEPVQRSGHGRVSGFRPDIEGLRAVAVLLVVADHLVGRPRGGFVGVDVFFVISGFLITSLLVGDAERHGRLSIVRFYERRARRILPAALTVLLACVVAANVVFVEPRISDTRTDVFWSLGFAANIHFADIGTDYFQQNRAPSLVQHFWSLAVEEQFYLVWPLLIIVVFAVFRHRVRPRQAQFALLSVICAGTAASFAWSLHESSAHAVTAYFSTPARAWELGVGAIVALVLPLVRRPTGRLGPAAGSVWLLALAGVVASGWLIDTTTRFPAPGAVLPVVSTAVLLAIGRTAAGAWDAVLTNPVVRYVGRVSFSLYLWHWPSIVISESLIPDHRKYQQLVALAAMTALTLASYHLVESPLRTASYRRVGLPRISREAWRAGTIATAGAVAAAVVAVVAYALVPSPPVNDFGVADRPGPTSGATSGPSKGSSSGPAAAALPADTVRPSSALSTSIDKALTATSFPTRLDPSLSDLTVEAAIKSWGRCGNGQQDVDRCTFGSSSPKARKAVLLGDSYALSWMPAVRAALPELTWRIYELPRGECPVGGPAVVNGAGDADFAQRCANYQQWAVAQTRKIAPELVIIANSDGTLDRVSSKSAPAATQYRESLQRTITKLDPGSRRHVLVLSPPPSTVSLEGCYTASASPADCVRPIKKRWFEFQTAERAAARSAGATYADTRLWFCNLANYCPGVIGSVAVRWDGVHISAPYATSLGPGLAAIVAKLV